MDVSVFTEKNIIPDDSSLRVALGDTYLLWKEIENYTDEIYPSGVKDWNFPGQKYGWSFRIKDKRRALLYFLPRENYFKIAFVFGQKAYDKIINSEVSDYIKEELKSAKVYAEGRGIRLDVIDIRAVEDIKLLLRIKLQY